MSLRLRVGHVEGHLKSEFENEIDMSDKISAADTQYEADFKTRALAALALQLEVPGAVPIELAPCVLDGTKDNGIDAIYVDVSQARIYLVQSKWHQDGRGSIAVGDLHKTLTGLKDLTEQRFDRFNDRLKPHIADVEEVLNNARITFTLILATSGADAMSTEVKQVLDDTLGEMNEMGEMLAIRYLTLAEFHEVVRQGGLNPKIDTSLALESWGVISEPHDAYYGLADGQALADLYNEHGGRLFDDNLRKALGTTPVNQEILRTLEDEPFHFWYFNNGVTALCDSVRKTGKHGSSRTSGDFAIEGLSIVNGAQTVSSLGSFAKSNPGKLAEVRVWVRLISLDSCPDGFATSVTRGTNTQNMVEGRDFIALDERQSEIRDDMRLSLGKVYVYKRGEPSPDPAEGCTVTDALIALACANSDHQFSVLAKSAIGRLEDTKGRYYPQLFTRSITARELWNLVLTLRAVEDALSAVRANVEGKKKAISVQGNRLVAHLAMRKLRESDLEAARDAIPSFTAAALDGVSEYIEKNYTTSYVTSLFKNSSKCGEIVRNASISWPEIK